MMNCGCSNNTCRLIAGKCYNNRRYFGASYSLNNFQKRELTCFIFSKVFASIIHYFDRLFVYTNYQLLQTRRYLSGGSIGIYGWIGVFAGSHNIDCQIHWEECQVVIVHFNFNLSNIKFFQNHLIFEVL